MTVYAIVNDLLGESFPIPDGSPVWGIISPAGILQGGNPYFVPDFASDFEARCALAVRIGRLGKGIARRFAGRYVEAVAPAVLFVATDLLASRRAAGLPWTSAISYDRCLALGRFAELPPADIDSCRVGLDLRRSSGGDVTSLSTEFPGVDFSSVIESLSRDNTIKTGDIILIAIAPDGPKAVPGYSAELSLNGESSLRFNIR